jgi:hypothetical protein
VQKGQNHPEDFADINLVKWGARKRRTTMLPNGSISRVLYSGRVYAQQRASSMLHTVKNKKDKLQHLRSKIPNIFYEYSTFYGFAENIFVFVYGIIF